MGKPINLDILQVPDGDFECICCKKVSKRNELRLKEASTHDGNKLVFISRTLLCSCDSPVWSMTAKE